MTKTVAKIIEENNSIKVDLGCGAAKQHGWVGIDYRAEAGVDIVHDLTLFPWPLPDNCASAVMASHLLEHMNPMSGDARIKPLIELLIAKKLVTKEEIQTVIGEIEPGPLFMRFMDEVWRILKPGGVFIAAFPYAGSAGFWQDPTHINGINEVTWAYFDPLEPNTQGALYRIYKPKPWKINVSSWHVNGNMEVALEKRLEDPSYYYGNDEKVGDLLVRKGVINAKDGKALNEKQG